MQQQEEQWLARVLRGIPTNPSRDDMRRAGSTKGTEGPANVIAFGAEPSHLGDRGSIWSIVLSHIAYGDLKENSRVTVMSIFFVFSS